MGMWYFPKGTTLTGFLGYENEALKLVLLVISD